MSASYLEIVPLKLFCCCFFLCCLHAAFTFCLLIYTSDTVKPIDIFHSTSSVMKNYKEKKKFPGADLIPGNGKNQICWSLCQQDLYVFHKWMLFLIYLSDFELFTEKSWNIHFCMRERSIIARHRLFAGFGTICTI